MGGAQRQRRQPAAQAAAAGCQLAHPGARPEGSGQRRQHSSRHRCARSPVSRHSEPSGASLLHTWAPSLLCIAADRCNPHLSASRGSLHACLPFNDATMEGCGGVLVQASPSGGQSSQYGRAAGTATSMRAGREMRHSTPTRGGNITAGGRRMLCTGAWWGSGEGGRSNNNHTAAPLRRRRRCPERRGLGRGTSPEGTLGLSAKLLKGPPPSRPCSGGRPLPHGSTWRPAVGRRPAAPTCTARAGGSPSAAQRPARLQRRRGSLGTRCTYDVAWGRAPALAGWPPGQAVS